MFVDLGLPDVVIIMLVKSQDKQFYRFKLYVVRYYLAEDDVTQIPKYVHQKRFLSFNAMLTSLPTVCAII